MGMILSCTQQAGAKHVESMTHKHFSAGFLATLLERNVAVYTRSKRDGQSRITSCLVQNDPPVVYDKKDQKVGYENKPALAQAQQAGYQWGLDLMMTCPEVKPIQEIDRWIENYFKQTSERETMLRESAEPKKTLKPSSDSDIIF